MGGLGFHSSVSSQPVHALLHNRQPNSCRPGVLGMKGFEDAKDPLMVAGLDSDGIVLDPKPNFFATNFGTDANSGPGSRPAEFDRVIEKLHQHFLQNRL